MSSKKPVSVLREVIPVVKKVRRTGVRVLTVRAQKAIDPRFDRAFGSFNADLFGKSYEFLGDLQQEERRQLQASLKKEKEPRRRDALKRTLDRIVPAALTDW